MIRDKVVSLNLETGRPDIYTAVKNLKNKLTTFKGQGYKAVIIIHGYGSSGVGGSIKTAVRKCLAENSMKGLVRDFVAGEEWSWNKKKFIDICRQLQEHDRRISGNPGVTVVILR